MSSASALGSLTWILENERPGDSEFRLAGPRNSCHTKAMSGTVDFQRVVYIDQRGIRFFQRDGEQWLAQELGELSLSTPPTDELIEAVQSTSVLVVVSDDWCGHLQMTLPNKKKTLEPDALDSVLSQEHGIDTSTYEFAYQRFPVNREIMQVSVSGIEKDTYTQVVEWVSLLATKQVWIMPLSWFVAPLKSIEPALLAVHVADDTLAISHHYLGVDDARELPFGELAEYVAARKQERKETHLLYLQAAKTVRAQLQKKLGDTVAIHPLVDDTNNDAVQEVVQAVMDKGTQTIAELLHYEESGTGKATVAAAAVITAPEGKKASRKKDAAEVSAETESEGASELPKPVPPVLPVVLDSEEVESVAEEPLDTVEAALPASKTDNPETVVDEPDQETKPVASESSAAVAAELPADDTAIVTEDEPVVEVLDDSAEELAPVSAAPAPARTMIDELASARQVKDVSQRYVEVQKRSSVASIVAVFLVATTLTAVIAGAIFFSQQPPAQQQAMLPDVEASPTPVLEVAPTPEPTPAPALSEEDKESTKIMVLNSTGMAGLAGKTRTQLASMGWAGDIDTGNASGAYSDAVFAYTTDDAVWTQLEQDWRESEQSVPLKRATEIDESNTSGYDLVIILAENVEW